MSKPSVPSPRILRYLQSPTSTHSLGNPPTTLAPSFTSESPSMSEPARPAGSYPSPTLSSAQYYPPTNNQPADDSYRASPTGSNGSMSLPSMRSLDPQQQMSSPLPHSPLPVAQMGGAYYHNQGQTLPHPSYSITSEPNPNNTNINASMIANMRYALPAGDARTMSGGRHKKEIKRRTKTGCLTCRKRRIKCDEQHPACRNCQKSKRECLGYDPIFKSQPGPAAIQPAPSAAPLQGGLSATANSYGHQPHMLGAYGQAMAYDPSLSAGSPDLQQYDYASAIDPALEATTAGSGQYSTPGNRNVFDLLNIGGVFPPRAPTEINEDPTTIEETKHLYYSIYAPGLEKFLETKWFSSKGLTKFLGDQPAMDLFGSLLVQLLKANTEHPEISYTNSVEARVVWAIASCVAIGARELNGTKSTGLVPPVDDPIEATHRLNVFESLLTGKIELHNRLTQPVPGSTDHHRLRELDFWHTLANFVCLRDDGPNAAKAFETNLAALRNLLDGRENRDILYSMAVIRANAPRVSEYTEADTPLHLDEHDVRSRVAVAKKFITDEASGSGTTNVIRRLCEIVTRSWSSIVPAEVTNTSPVPKVDA